MRIADVPKFKKYSIYTVGKSLDWFDSGQSLFIISGETIKTLKTILGDKPKLNNADLDESGTTAKRSIPSLRRPQIHAVVWQQMAELPVDEF